jgi:hypothetical protein
MDMMTGNDISLPGIKPSTPTTTYGHWQEGKSGISPQLLRKNKIWQMLKPRIKVFKKPIILNTSGQSAKTEWLNAL